MRARLWRSPGAAVFALCCVALIFLSGFGVRGFAQNTPTSRSQSVSRFELYGEYSYLHPQGADIYNMFEPSITTGGVAGVNYFFTRHYGVEAEGAFHKQDTNYDCMFTGQAGPVARLQVRRFVPFAHVLGGGAKIAGPAAQPCTWGWELTGGVGVDYIVPGLGGHLAVRPIQADFEYNHVDYGAVVLPDTTHGGLLKENAYRLSAGVVFRLGNMSDAEPTSMSCSAVPGDVYAGEPVSVSARTLDRKSRHLSYAWATDGGRISGKGETITVDTSGLAPGNYDVTGSIGRGARGHNANCNARFSVRGRMAATAEPQLQEAPKQVEPRAGVSCVAAPAYVLPGGIATITTSAPTADGRALTYSYTTTAGTVTGNGPTATFSPGGMTTGTATITCTVADGAGASASGSTTVQMLQASVPAEPQTETLCTLSFERDRARPARVDNAAKACLDDIALTLQREPESSLDMVGSTNAGEPRNVAEQRAVNAKLYLTREKGIDGSRIKVHGEAGQGRVVQNMLIPAGMAYEPGESFTFDENRVSTPYQAYAAAGVASTRGVVRHRTVSRRRVAVRRHRAMSRRGTTTRRRRTIHRDAPAPEAPPSEVSPVPSTKLRDYVPPRQTNPLPVTPRIP